MDISQNYANEKSYKLYIDYLALKKHFTTKGYDYHKYRGKVKASFEKFRSRNDAFFFYKLSKKDDPHEILLANIVSNPKAWIREISEDSGQEVYFSWKKKMQSITHTFKTDLSQLKEEYKDNFIVKGGQHPYLITLFLQKKISLETFTILIHVSKVFPYWEKEIVDKIVASDIIQISKKYYPFLEVDENKFSSIIKERFF